MERGWGGGGVNRDSSPLALARNQPFLCQMFKASPCGLEFSRCLKLFHFFVSPVFQCASLPIFCGFSAVITLLASNYEPAIIFRAVFALDVISKCRKWHLTGRRARPQAHQRLAHLAFKGSSYATLKTSTFLVNRVGIFGSK